MIDKAELDEVLICEINDSIFDVSLMLRQTLSKHCVVVDKDSCLKGLISIQDIVYRGVCEELELKSIPISTIMSQKIESISIDESEDEICEKLSNYTNHYFPVINSDEKVIGGIDIWRLYSLLQSCRIK